MVNVRNKGASFEREVANYLKLHLSLQDIKRDIEQYRTADRGDIIGIKNYTIECKRYKRPESANGFSVGNGGSKWLRRLRGLKTSLY